ncbi:hypothetical protein [Lysinibacillus pakistanensis]|uniref:Uncharacterized protein n=1 Tax=Lysinibacillus pakistanensis TaxID=759811 RepID=A0ABX6DGE1_9BACI|nr:hypothetical protein GDS87_14390 [Lysinibacillus pakistanensis]
MYRKYSGSNTVLSVAKAKRQLQMFSVAKAKRQLQLCQGEIDLKYLKE